MNKERAEPGNLNSLHTDANEKTYWQRYRRWENGQRLGKFIISKSCGIPGRLAQEQAAYLGEMAAAFTESAKLANEVEFWRWMGANYPQHFSSAEQIRQTAAEKAEWMRTQI